MTDKTDKVLRARGLTTADHAPQKYTTYFEVVAEDVGYDDLFNPGYWRHHKKLQAFDIIRLRHPRGDFDVMVTVRAVVAGGVSVEFFSGRPPLGVDPYEVEARVRDENDALRVVPIAADGRPVVRAEYLNKTKWRILGIGSEEIKRDIATKEEAEVELAIYLASMKLRMPTPEEQKAALAEREKKAEPAKPAKTPEKV